MNCISLEPVGADLFSATDDEDRAPTPPKLYAKPDACLCQFQKDVAVTVACCPSGFGGGTVNPVSPQNPVELPAPIAPPGLICCADGLTPNPHYQSNGQAACVSGFAPAPVIAPVKPPTFVPPVTPEPPTPPTPPANCSEYGKQNSSSGIPAYTLCLACCQRRDLLERKGGMPLGGFRECTTSCNALSR